MPLRTEYDSGYGPFILGTMASGRISSLNGRSLLIALSSLYLRGLTKKDFCVVRSPRNPPLRGACGARRKNAYSLVSAPV